MTHDPMPLLAGALGLGMVAGLVSTLGFAFLQPALEATLGLRDTCGVLNLHGIPGVLGGIAAAIASVLDFEANKQVCVWGGKWGGVMVVNIGLGVLWLACVVTLGVCAGPWRKNAVVHGHIQAYSPAHTF